MSESATQRFDRLVEALLGIEGVTPPRAGGRAFGSHALKVHGRIFAMQVGERLVVKLPARRVAEQIAAGSGEPFDAGKGTPMREWLTVAATDDETWQTLAREALEFVAAAR